jgi:hypothetical protein
MTASCVISTREPLGHFDSISASVGLAPALVAGAADVEFGDAQDADVSVASLVKELDLCG